MDIETQCTGCGKLLTVAAEHAGRSARCPVCNTIYVVPQPAAREPTAANFSTDNAPAPPDGTAGVDVAAGSMAPPPPITNWFMKTPEGPIYGPVPRTELSVWVRDGRVTHDCQLRLENESQWQSADIEFPALRPPPQPAYAPHNATESAAVNYRTMYQLPHRGPLILTLGVMGLVVWCPILSVMAWVMGTNDLREMRGGQRDASGQSLTQAGQMLGLILSMLWIVAAVITVGIIVFIAAFR